MTLRIRFYRHQVHVLNKALLKNYKKAGNGYEGKNKAGEDYYMTVGDKEKIYTVDYSVVNAMNFDETGEHGLVVGDITKEKLKIKFVKMDDTQFEVKTIDISNCMSPNEVLDKLNLKDNIYKIILTGIRNIDISTLKEIITVSGKYVCEVEDKTKMDYNLEGIAMQKTLKGVFTRKMLEEIKNNPDKEEKIMKAIEYVYNNM